MLVLGRSNDFDTIHPYQNYNSSSHHHGSFFAHDPIVKGNWILLEVEPSVWREKTITVVEIWRIKMAKLPYQWQTEIRNFHRRTSDSVNCPIPPSNWHDVAAPRKIFFQVLCYSNWGGSIPFLLRSWHRLMIILKKNTNIFVKWCGISCEKVNIPPTKRSTECYRCCMLSGWWFQPIWKILVILEIFPK